ncbi:hypothetical protein M413DRAFT_32041 [Hebeloma cylindrosporum]|uniref:Uncharacterized protein n=1 Tax=Hebeloma cylindrosporum TaxID=76867 RepID=A0A0C3BVA2_HEBCY|nr:hypothetical protein M413DRAFT_32041 [Hebeloma cylindrosporum h7]
MPSSTKSTEFPDIQKAFLKSFLPEYEKYISQHNPDHKSHSKDLKEWRVKKARDLIKDPCIQDLVNDSPVEAKEWEMAIRRFYTNYYNNKFLPASRRAQASQLPVPSNIPLPNTTSPIPHTNKDVDDVLRRAIVTFLGDLSAREMFASENEEAIRKKMDEIRAENPDSTLIGGGLRSKALKILWQNEDQDVWKSKIDALAQDIEVNREEFPALMLQALQNLCNRKQLGSTLMSFSYAFRDTKMDWIKGGMILAGYDDHKKKSVTVEPSDRKAQIDAFFVYADTVLSRKPRVSVYQIPLNKDGIPIPPQVDVLTASIIQLATLLEEYLSSLWEFAQQKGCTLATGIPWEDIASSPDAYFDTSVYKLPCALRSPEELKCEPFSIVALYQYFSTISASQPFRFRLREAISDTIDSDSDLNSSPGPPVRAVPSSILGAPISTQSTMARTMTSPVGGSAIPVTSNRPCIPQISAQSTTTIATGSPSGGSTGIQESGNSSVEGRGHSSVDAPGNSSVDAPGNSSVDAPGNSSVEAPKNSKPKKGKATKKSKPTAALGDQAQTDANGPPARRSSTRTVDLKRKKMDMEAHDTQPTKKKRTLLKDRWAYVSEEPKAGETS